MSRKRKSLIAFGIATTIAGVGVVIHRTRNNNVA